MWNVDDHAVLLGPARPSARPAAPVLTEPSPISPTRFTPAGRHLGEVVLLEPQLEDRRAGMDLHARRAAGSRTPCAATIASALSPTMSLGRPGRWTSPAEIAVVTPPWSPDSMKSIVRWRGVKSPNTGWTWRVDEPGNAVAPLRVDDDVRVRRRGRARSPRSARPRSGSSRRRRAARAMSPGDDLAEAGDQRSHRSGRPR